MESAAASLSAAEVAKFAKIADRWWDLAGPFRPLHKLNPERLRFLRDRLGRHFDRDTRQPLPFAGLRLLDIGCGGGLIAEPLTRLGFTVTGLDAADENIEVAKVHAARDALSIAYRVGTPETLTDEPPFDVVLALEVVEHVADTAAFFQAATALVKPGGVFIAATINRTVKSLLLAKIGAEYILRWLEPGTHDWSKFMRPSELAGDLRRMGLTVTELAGLSYDVIADDWRMSRDLDVNYFAMAVKPT